MLIRPVLSLEVFEMNKDDFCPLQVRHGHPKVILKIPQEGQVDSQTIVDHTEMGFSLP